METDDHMDSTECIYQSVISPSQNDPLLSG